MRTEAMRSLCCRLLFLALAGCSSADPCATDPTRCLDAAVDGGTCAGTCVPKLPMVPLQVLLWTGSSGATPPTCPDAVPTPNPGFADVAPAVDCAPCLCLPSGGQCYLPQQVTAGAEACPGGQQLPFDPPAPWDGTCSAMGSVSSATSVTVSPPALASGCTPTPSAPPVSVAGGTPAQTCGGLNIEETGTCSDPDQMCAFANGGGFSSCVLRGVDGTCPEGWPIKHLFYTLANVCTCLCGSAVGDSCSTTVTVYADGACSTPLASVLTSSDKPAQCGDVTPASMLGGISATLPTYTSGTCSPMSAALEYDTLCCLP